MRKFLLFLFALFGLCAQAQTCFRTISHDEALTAAKTEGKLLFMDFYTDWCGPCKMMARTVFPNSRLGEYMNAKFVSVKLNAEKGEGETLAKKYGIKAYPTFIVVDADDKEIGRTVGYHDVDGFIEELDRMTDPGKSPEMMKARYDKGERSAGLIRAYASYLKESLYDRKMSMEEYRPEIAKINKIVTDYYSTLSDADKLKSENIFVYRTYTDDVESGAARFMVVNRNRFATADRAEVDSIIKNLYYNYVCLCLSGEKPYDAGKTAAIKNDIKTLGLDTDGIYDTAFKVIDAEAGGTDQYLAACDKSIKDMDQTFQTSLVQGICDKYQAADDASKRKASQMIRRHLQEFSVSVLYSSVMALAAMEGH